MVPDGLYYTQDHEWVRMEGDQAVVGITDHAQSALGDITYVEVPRIGKVVKGGAPLAVIESVKAASEITAPVAGTVAAVNEVLSKTPETINQFPYEAGWICRLKNIDKAGVKALMTAEQYRQQLAET
jgi:glycine cleavage system H protein